MSEHRDVVVEWAEVSAEAGGPGYRPPQRPAARSFAGVGIATGVIALAAVILGLAVRPSGVGPATSAAASSSAAAVASAASGSPAAPTPSTPIGPVSDQTDDGTVRLSLKIPSNAFEIGQPIEPVAILEYLGPDPAITIYHAASPIVFQIQEVGGARTMDGGTDTPCLSTKVTSKVPVIVHFQKSGSPTTDATRGFDTAWYQDPVLTLPAGRWRVVAQLDVYTASGDQTCGGTEHRLEVSNEVSVGDVSPSAVASFAAPGTPAPSLSADASAAREIAAKYVDAIATGHSEQAWPLLSDWSKRTAGSFMTFADVEARLARLDPRRPAIGDPSRDPTLLDPSVLGERAADIAATADAARAYVVPLVPSPSGSLTAGTTNLVIAPVQGRWRIWLDADHDSYGAEPFPDGCAAYELSVRRCPAVVALAAKSAGFDPTTADRVWLMPDPGCGEDPLVGGAVICTRSQGFVAGVRFDRAGQPSVREDVYCGVGPPSLACSENPGIQANDLHGGYWDVTCSGEPPAGCPSPIPTPRDPDHVGRELKIASLDIPLGAIGHHEVDIGTAVLVDGVVQEATFRIDQVQDTFLLDPGVIRLELRSTLAGRPPFDNIYARGVIPGPEPVRVILIYDVAETAADVRLHITDVDVR